MPQLSKHHLTRDLILAQAKPGTILWDSECRGLGLRTSSGGTQTWLVKYRLPAGGQRKPSIGRWPLMSVAEARKVGRQTLSQADRGEDLSASRREARAAVTLDDILHFYAGDYASANKLDAQTVMDAKTVIRIYVDPRVMSRAASSFAYPDVVTIVARALQIGREREEARVAAAAAQKRIRRSPAHPGVAQANRLIAVLSKLFNLGKTMKNANIMNPVEEVVKNELDERMRNFTESEVQRLLTACDAYDARGPAFSNGAADAVRLLLFTGARLQEVLSAVWSQFDLERAIWTKPSAHTKQRKLHILGLGGDGPAIEVLRRLREYATSGTFLFPGTPVLDVLTGHDVERPRSDLKRPWAWIAKHAGLEGDRPHDLRRTTASFMINDGTPLAIVGASLGHTQEATTRRYAKLGMQVQAGALQASTKRMVAPREPDIGSAGAA